MDYKEFEKAVDTLGILTKTSRKDLKKKYLKLSKKYHPDMPEGSEEKFLELKKSYDILVAYMDSYQYNFDLEEYKEQFPASFC
jgi:DnaJ-class molecular chaperone